MMSEALRKAAQAILDYSEDYEAGKQDWPEWDAKFFALKAALAEPEQSEPVGEIIEEYGFTQAVVAFYPVNGEAQQMKVGEKVYAAPPRREPLSDEKIDEIYCKVSEAFDAGRITYESTGFARAIKAAHGITGGKK
jgi:hypothetical protein